MPEHPLAAVADSHDSFVSARHVNWLVNSAGLGAYAHGRVHQEGPFGIFVGDLIHKRGPFATDDVLKMEEQSLPSMGDPLTVSSRLGELKALVLLPAMSSANGEGDLIGYYEGGVVSFDTFKAPRETRIDGEGKTIQKGWAFERVVSHLLNTTSAVGPNAVAVTPRDHFFRSPYGLHFLKTSLGEGSFNPEHINSISQDTQPLLDADSPELLEGAAVGVWLRGNRLFATVGLHTSECHSAVSLAKGFISINQAVTFTEDRTPRMMSEGVWVLDHGMQGLHHFSQTGMRPEKGSYGFLASDRDADLYFASIDEHSEEDERDGDWFPIEWSCETGCHYGSSPLQRKKLADGVMEGYFSSAGATVRVLVRTNQDNKWAVWKEFSPCSKEGGRFFRSEPLGQPPATHREASWFQFRIEGVGYVEISDLRYAMVDAGGSSGQGRCIAVESCDEDPFLTNNEPITNRWPKL